MLILCLCCFNCAHTCGLRNTWRDAKAYQGYSCIRTCSRHTAAISSVDLGIHLSPGVITHCSRDPCFAAREQQQWRRRGRQRKKIKDGLDASLDVSDRQPGIDRAGLCRRSRRSDYAHISRVRAVKRGYPPLARMATTAPLQLPPPLTTTSKEAPPVQTPSLNTMRIHHLACQQETNALRLQTTNTTTAATAARTHAPLPACSSRSLGW